MARDLKMVVLLSAPRVGFTEHFAFAQNALLPFNAQLLTGLGAFWHQSMQTLMEKSIDDGFDWLLTLDYDTLFTSAHVNQLMESLGENPEIDCVAALQPRRCHDLPLMHIRGDEEGEVKFPLNGPPFKVSTAHFGCTLFRAESFRDLPKPWFRGEPNAEGSYKDDRRTDADIWFWNHWATHGRTLYVDPRCRIGHIEMVASDFGPDGKVRHRYVHKWREQEVA